MIGSFSPGTPTAKRGSVATLLPVWHLRIRLDFAERIISSHEWRSGWSGAFSPKNRTRAGLTSGEQCPPPPQPPSSALRPVEKHRHGGLKVPWDNVPRSHFPALLASPTVQHAPRGFGERESWESCLFYSASPVLPGLDLPGQNRNAALETTDGLLRVPFKSSFEARVLSSKSLHEGEFTSLLVKATKNRFLVLSHSLDYQGK